MNYYVYGGNHRLCRDLTVYHDKINPDMVKFCVSRNLREADGVACAYQNKILLGFFRFDIDAVDGTMYTNGTYVNPFLRKNGIALNLWKRAIIKHNPKKVVAVITSQGGLNLVEKASDFFPEITFCKSIQIV